MAKINLTTQQNQENFSVLSSLGILVCMVVTIMGIKLWWFKHRLSFEQSSTQNGSGGGGTPAVIVPRRSKQQKYKKDKRYSQQIYESVEVHGVFRQKREDDVEIQRPQQLPPVRIRQISESMSSLILPPPRTKRREQVHSTAFEDLEIVTPPLTTASSSDLTAIPEISTKITLTFEEFERQFKLKEIKSEAAEAINLQNEVTEIPVPPLRLNRSSSAMTKPEKPQHFLKSSQSITIPEFRKVIEKRPDGFSSPKEDLTKIDDYDEPKIFETFGERRPTGYIKYEEVDSDLQSQYERELNAEVDKDYYQSINSGSCGSPGVMPALKALRNERIIYNNDLNESPDAQLTAEYNFSKTPYKWKDADYKQEDFVNHKLEIKELSSAKFEELDSENTKEGRSTKFINDSKNVKENVNTEFEIITERDPIELAGKEYDTDFRSIKVRRPTDCMQDGQSKELKTKFYSSKENRSTEHVQEPEIFEKAFVTEFHVPTKFIENCQDVEKKIFTESNSVNGYIKNPQAKEQTSKEIFYNTSFQEDFDNQFSTWPQFEEKIETPKVNVRRFNNHDLATQSSFEVNDDCGITNFNESFCNESETEHQTETNQRRPTGFVRDSTEPPEPKHMEEWREDSNNKFYNQIRSFMTTEHREVTFDDSSLDQNSDSEDRINTAIRERRPTGFVRKDEYFVTFSDESDEDYKENFSTKRENLVDNVHSTVEIVEIQAQKVNFADGNFSEDKNEKFTLNQRRPTGFFQPLNNEGTCNDIDCQGDSKDISTIQVKFAETTDFKDEQEVWDSDIKRRRPTGYIKQLEMLDVTGEDNTLDKQRQQANKKDYRESDEIPKNYFETTQVLHNSPNVKFKEIDESFKDYQSNTESLLKQRRPTGCMRKEELDKMEKQVNFQLDNEESNIGSKNNEALSQRRPTGFIRKEEITKHVNFELNQISHADEPSQFGNEQLKQRRPTGFVRKNELKCLDQPAPIFHPSNYDHNNEDFDSHLWQEMENDIEQDVANNFEEEFAKIRHSYELNEADFLEVKDEFEKSPTNNTRKPSGFGKSIEDDWENFEHLKAQTVMKPLQSPQEIKITFSDAELNATTSILKEQKFEEDIQPKPRKSKVTFDFKTEERVIPAREGHNYSEEDSDYDNDKYNKQPPSMPPPRPMQRVSNINYNTEETLSPIVPIPKEISLFGSHISRQDNAAEDSWSAIRKHRSLTEEFQNLSTESKLSPPFITPPSKPSYRNPMAQLAIQRAKEVRADMDGFKSRSISDRKSDTIRRQKEKFLNLNGDPYESTEA